MFRPSGECSVRFQSALPLRGSDMTCPQSAFLLTHFNPRPPCGERQQRQCQLQLGDISIRAPLAGSDCPGWRRCSSSGYFNPRSPCGERHGARARPRARRLFQSALPLRGATGPRSLGKTYAIFQSALPLRGATSLVNGINDGLKEFQSALPLRGATATFCSITLLSAKYCIFKDRRRKFSRQIPQNSSEKRLCVVRTSFIEHDRPWFAIS